MTEKQRLFCLEYLKDLNGSRAYKSAYPNIKSDNAARVRASQLLDKLEIQKFIQEKLEKIEEAKIADVKEIMQYLTSVMRGESKADVLAMCGDGCQEVINKPPDEKERLKAAELLGKRYQMWTSTDKMDENRKVTIINDLPK